MESAGKMKEKKIIQTYPHEYFRVLRIKQELKIFQKGDKTNFFKGIRIRLKP